MENEFASQNTLQIQNEEELFNGIAALIEESRKQISKSINTAMVYTYYGVGQYIVEYEQGGNARAEYGKGVLKVLSGRLTDKYGEGWSYANLRSMRQFYMIYSKMLTSGQQIQNDDQRSAIPIFRLPWTHYQILMRVDNPQARSFYEIEAANQQWSKRQLQRQVASSLFECLALSRDQDEVMHLATKGQTIEKSR